MSQVVEMVPSSESTNRQDAVLGQVRKLVSDGMPQAEIARGAGVSTTAVSQVLNGSYTGNVDNIIAKLERWLTARNERSELLAGLPTAPNWFTTPTAARIQRTLNYAQVANDIALIVGGAGAGKTSACRHYATEWPNVWHVEMTRSHGRQLAALERIAARIGVRDVARAPSAIQDAIQDRVRGTQGLLIVDEAQHLEIAALDAVRAIHDGTSIGIAFVGNESISTKLNCGSKASDNSQISSRIGKQVRLALPTAGDVSALADAWNVTDADARKLLSAIASKPGALRICTKALRLASVMAGSTGISAAQIREAWAELGASP